jgi:UDP-glucose 4-epimerase
MTPTTAAPCAGRRVLVTGGAGFIGSHLVDAIAGQDPAALVVADSFFIGRRENLTEASSSYAGLVIEEIDAADMAAIEEVVNRHRVEVVFDLATIPLPYSLEHPYPTVETNVALALNLAELARRGAYETLVHVSSSEVYGTATEIPMTEDHPMVPLTPYAAGKAAADHIVSSYVATFGIDATIVRPFNTYGPRQNEGGYAGLIPIAVRRALAGEPVTVFGDGTQTRDFLYVVDTARGILSAYPTDRLRGRTLNLASGTETSVNEVVAAVFEILGLPPKVEHVDPRPGDVARHCGSSAAAEQALGFTPTTSLRSGLEATIEWYRSRNGGGT